jgi:tetratricopeptide (TPR) repeat protein
MDTPTLEELLENDPRFTEIHYFLSLGLAFTGKIDAAMDHLLKAYDWRNRWPVVTNMLGVDYIALEEFAPAIDFFDRTIAVVPNHADARLNKAKALTYAGRYEQSLAIVDQLLADNLLVGDARYWRALNEANLNRNDEAWEDVELADKLLVNAQVPKLAGLIAYRRKHIDISRDKFELSRRRYKGDCQTGYYLGTVLGELTEWTRAVGVLTETVSCFEQEEERLNAEIAGIQQSSQAPERRERQVQKRELQIAANRRMVVTSWYNTAVGYFRLSKSDDARQFAEKVVGDDEFGERARELLARLR